MGFVENSEPVLYFERTITKQERDEENENVYFYVPCLQMFDGLSFSFSSQSLHETYFHSGGIFALSVISH